MIYIFRWVLKLNLRLLFKTICWQTMNLVAGWKKLKEMWSIDFVLSDDSFNSISSKSDLFCKMFPDSKIAESFSCGKTKCRYVIYFGLAPYSKELLTKSLSNVEHIVTLFDESFNKTSCLLHGQQSQLYSC